MSYSLDGSLTTTSLRNLSLATSLKMRSNGTTTSNRMNSNNINRCNSNTDIPDFAAVQAQQQQIPSPSTLLLTREMQQRALLHLNEAIELLPERESSAVQRARCQWPQTFESESNPLLYLSMMDWNTFAAAQRLAVYWKQRQDDLGADAFTPLSTAEEITAASTKTVKGESKKPVSSTSSSGDEFDLLESFDALGRRIFLLKIDTNSRQRKVANLRKVYSLLSTNISSKVGNTEIVLLIYVEPCSRVLSIDPRLQNLLRSGMPWTLHAVHVVCPSPTSTSTTSSSPYSNRCALTIQLPPEFQQKILMHASSDRTEMLQGIEACGIPTDVLSKELEHLPDKRNHVHLDRKLSPEEKMSKKQRVSQPPPSPAEPEKQARRQNKGLEELQFAIAHLPPDSKAAYLEAMERAPELIDRESDPAYFLDREDQDPWAAASRLVAYWERRKELFADRAFLPLDVMDATGALSFNDLEVMATGVLVELPQDALGRDVFCFDRSRFIGSSAALQLSLLRSLFYWCYLTMANEEARTTGVVAVTVIQELASDVGRMDAKPAMDLINDSFPIKIHSIHLCLVGKSNDLLTRLKQTVLPAIMMRLKCLGSIQCIVHTAPVPVQEYANLQVPEWAGGQWSYENFNSWFENRRKSGKDQCPEKRSATAKPALESPSNTSEDSSAMEASLDLLSAAAVEVLSSNDVEGNAKSNIIGPRRVANAPNVRVSPGGRADESVFVETASVQLEGIRRLEEAMDLLSEEEKSGYVAATRCVPYLVQTESDPLKFLKCEAYNAWAAAHRLAYYWKKRLEIFGDRAFLPLTLSGNGALNEEDVASFYAGYMSFLPNDYQGRTVLCYDPQKRNVQSIGERLRVSFYVWSIICENERSVTNGFVGIVILGTSRFGGSTIDATISVCSEIVMQAFPTFPHKMHLVNSPSGLGQRIFYEVILPIVIRYMERMLRDCAIVHVGTNEQLIQKLGCFGFTQATLPDSLGGPWTTHEHITWVKERLRIENGRYNALVRVAQDKSKTARSQSKICSDQTPEEEIDRETSLSTSPVTENATLGEERVAETPEALEAGLEELQRAIDAIPLESKASYLRALEACPELVKKESDPVTFLRFDRFDAVAGARRLAKYWEVRDLIFEGRAYLPLNQTGEGALDRRDLSVLGTAYLMCLAKDSHGRAVLVCDGTRLSRSTRQSRLRTSFYMYSIAAETKISQTSGIVLLYVMTEPSFDRANKECLDTVLSAIPACIRDVHLLRYPSDSSEQGFSIKMDPAMLHQFRQIAKNQVIPHVTSSRATISKRLEPYGLVGDELPKAIGGKFGYDRFVQWQELRTRYEWDLPAGVSNKQAADLFDFSKVTPLSKLTEAERLERKRRLNVVHSRRKRERERIEIEVLNEQCDEQQERKKSLHREYHRLKTLVHRANALVQTVGGSGNDVAYRYK